MDSTKKRKSIINNSTKTTKTTKTTKNIKKDTDDVISRLSNLSISTDLIKYNKKTKKRWLKLYKKIRYKIYLFYSRYMSSYYRDYIEQRYNVLLKIPTYD